MEKRTIEHAIDYLRKLLEGSWQVTSIEDMFKSLDPGVPCRAYGLAKEALRKEKGTDFPIFNAIKSLSRKLEILRTTVGQQTPSPRDSLADE